MVNEKLIDLEGAYEDLKNYLLNISINCCNCVHFKEDSKSFKKESKICRSCKMAYYWEINPKVIEKIEEDNLIESDSYDIETTKLFCEKCGNEMTVDTSYRLASNPPKYEAFCSCGFNSYIKCEDYVGA